MSSTSLQGANATRAPFDLSTLYQTLLAEDRVMGQTAMSIVRSVALLNAQNEKWWRTADTYAAIATQLRETCCNIAEMLESAGLCGDLTADVFKSERDIELLRVNAARLWCVLSDAKKLQVNAPEKVTLTANWLIKKSKALVSKSEALSLYMTTLNCIADTLQFNSSGYFSSSYSLASRAWLALRDWDKAGDNGARVDQSLGKSLVRSIGRDGYISLAVFVCPPMEYSSLQTESPENYIRLSFTSSFLEKQLVDFRALNQSLKKFDVPVRWRFILADTDDDDYLWPILGRPENLSGINFENRWNQLLDILRKYLTKGENAALDSSNLDVKLLSQIPPGEDGLFVTKNIIERPLQFFSESELANEKKRMGELWSTYYFALREPTDDELTNIIYRKWAAYACQGVMVAEHFRDSVLIITEQPPLLRTRMFNNGLAALKARQLPVVYQQRP